ncbi:MAG: glycosyltransferase family 2 protein [Verrucomicrobiae bacterium]|nr:glycosyltransferase family 2 protein [Verrucomicrobiae bacterium]
MISAPSLDLSIVVPIYNETENLPELLAEIDGVLGPLGLSYEITLVNDGSTDGSETVLERLSSQFPALRVLHFEKNAGQSAALHAGLNAARGRLLVSLDGDLQNDPADIPAMLDLLETHDLVCGFRKNRRDTWSKRAASRIANFVRSRFVGDGVRDTGCTLKAYRRGVIHTLPNFRGMHRFIPAFVKGHGYRITEMPVNHRARIHGVSKYSVAGRAFKATRDMFGVRWLLARRCPYTIRK